jgi:hypothetical protein
VVRLAAATLEEEIRFIFSDHARLSPQRFRIDFEEQDAGEQYLEAAAEDGNCVVRAVRRGSGSNETKVPDPIEQGWIAFLHQLRRYLESHSSDPRRTLHLTGAGPASQIAAAVDSRLPGELWFSGPYTRVYGTGDFGPGLGVLFCSAELDSGDADRAMLTLSTWGLSDADFFELTSDWLGWWQGLVEGGEAVVHPA